METNMLITPFYLKKYYKGWINDWWSEGLVRDRNDGKELYLWRTD